MCLTTTVCMFLAISSLCMHQEHSGGVRTSSQGVQQKFGGSILLWFLSFLELLFDSLQIEVCLHSKEPMAVVQLCPAQSLGRCSSAWGHLWGHWDVFWGCLPEPGHICCTSVKPFAQPAANALTRMISEQIAQLFIALYIAGAGPGAVWRVSPPAHRPQRPPDKSRDMNKGQGSLPWATKAVLENKNSTERAHKRQKILPSCQLLCGPCLQRRGVQGQGYPGLRSPTKEPPAQPSPGCPHSP